VKVEFVLKALSGMFDCGGSSDKHSFIELCGSAIGLLVKILYIYLEREQLIEYQVSFYFVFLFIFLNIFCVLFLCVYVLLEREGR